MKYCRYCGNPVNDFAVVCIKCGGQVTPTVQQPQAAPQAPVQAYPQRPVQPQAYPQAPVQAYPQRPVQPQTYPQAPVQAYPQRPVQPQAYPQAPVQAYPQRSVQPQAYPQAPVQAYAPQPVTREKTALSKVARTAEISIIITFIGTILISVISSFISTASSFKSNADVSSLYAGINNSVIFAAVATAILSLATLGACCSSILKARNAAAPAEPDGEKAGNDSEAVTGTQNPTDDSQPEAVQPDDNNAAGEDNADGGEDE